MDELNFDGISSVQCKIKCLFDVKVADDKSTKRSGQNYKVLASENFSEDAVKSSYESAFVSEKIDGTCCYVFSFKDCFSLWARLDRKMTKNANKKLQNYNHKKFNELKGNGQSELEKINFDYPSDFKVVPDAWIPANNVNRHPETNNIIPDDNGHVPGWVPIHVDPKQYCWHHSTVCDEFKLLLILKDFGENSGPNKLLLTVEPMSNYDGKTLELIGTNVNANPYELGTKQSPFHVLVPHGSVRVHGFPIEVDAVSVKSWFNDETQGNVEGMVWRCTNGKLFKLHRHHIGLKWPLRCSRATKNDGESENDFKPFLSRREVKVSSERLQSIDDTRLSDLFVCIKRLHSRTVASLFDMASNWKLSLAS